MAESRAQQPRDGFIAVGRVLRPWGLQGDVKVESLTDFPDRFEYGERLWLLGTEREVEYARWQKGALYLKLAGIDDADAAETTRGGLLEAPEATLRPLQPGEFYEHQLVGLLVSAGDGDALGDVREVLPTGGNAVLVVHGPRGELLIPFIEQVVKSVDLVARQITVELLDGMEGTAEAGQTPDRTRQATRAPRRAGGMSRRLNPPV